MYPSALFIFLILNVKAQALPFAPLPPPATNISKTNFIPAQEGLRDLRAPLNMLAASPKIEFVDANGKVFDYCSGSVVSDSGTILTAGHCVEKCLRAANLITQIDGVSAVDRPRLGHARCSVKINGRISSAEILATNDCRGEDLFKSGSAKISCKGVDYAVLKVDDPALKSQPCFNMSAQVPKTGTDVAAIGFPPMTARSVLKTGAADSDGKGPFLTVGNTMAFQNHCRTDIDPPRTGQRGEKPTDWSFGNPERARILKHQIESGNALQTTADVLRGVSGAGLADINSYRLVGVARSTMLNNANLECRGSGFFTTTASILAAIKNDFPELDLDQAIRCDKNSFARQNETPAPRSAPNGGSTGAEPQITR